MSKARKPPAKPLSAEEQIARNRMLTYVLLVLFILNAGILILLVGWLTKSWAAVGAMLAFFAVFVAGAAAWFDRVVLAAVNARRMARGEHPRLEAVVGRLSPQLGIQEPAVHIIDEPHLLDAFSCGRDAEKGYLVVTQGLLTELPADELEAVAAHELAHIANRDTRLSMWSYALLGWVTLISWLAYAAIEGLQEVIGRIAESLQSSGGLFALLLTAVLLFLQGLLVSSAIAVFLWSLLARLVDLAIWRRREFLADAFAAQTTRRPLALASALERIAQSPGLGRGEALAGKLCIVAPMGRRRPWWEELLSSHPALERRIELLMRMAQAQRMARKAPGRQ